MGQEKTLTRMDLSEAVFREVGADPQRKARNSSKSVLQHMSDSLVRGRDGEDIILRHLQRAQRRAARHRPQSQDRREVPIHPRRVLTFRPSHLNEGPCSGRQQGRLRRAWRNPPEAFTDDFLVSRRTGLGVADPMCCDFWESRFPQIKRPQFECAPAGGVTIAPSDMALIGGIKRLLHDDGMTIRGATGNSCARRGGENTLAALSKPLDGMGAAEIVTTAM